MVSNYTKTMGNYKMLKLKTHEFKIEGYDGPIIPEIDSIGQLIFIRMMFGLNNVFPKDILKYKKSQSVDIMKKTILENLIQFDYKIQTMIRDLNKNVPLKKIGNDILKLESIVAKAREWMPETAKNHKNYEGYHLALDQVLEEGKK